MPVLIDYCTSASENDEELREYSLQVHSPHNPPARAHTHTHMDAPEGNVAHLMVSDTSGCCMVITHLYVCFMR